MNKAALSFTSQFLEELNDRFANDGCNDFEMPNTPANVRLLCDAIRWGYGTDADEVIAQVKAEAKEGAKTIMTMNNTLCGYLAHLAKQEADK